jgi:hypothetical protein
LTPLNDRRHAQRSQRLHYFSGSALRNCLLQRHDPPLRLCGCEGFLAELGAAGGQRPTDLDLHKIGLVEVEALWGVAEQPCRVNVAPLGKPLKLLYDTINGVGVSDNGATMVPNGTRINPVNKLLLPAAK